MQRNGGRARRQLRQWHVFCLFCWWMQFALCSRRCPKARQVPFPCSSWTRLFVARLCNDRFRGPDSFSLLEVPQLQLIFKVAVFPVVEMRLIPVVQHWLTGEIPQLPYIWYSMSLLCRCRCFWSRQRRTLFGGSADAVLRVKTSRCSSSDSSSCRRDSWMLSQTSPSTSSQSVSEVGFFARFTGIVRSPSSWTSRPGVAETPRV